MEQITCPSKCELCDQTDGAYYCYECQKSICQKCRNIHDKVLSTVQHTVIESQHADRTISNSTMKCKTHGRMLVHSCENCSVLTCSLCVTSCHKGHSFSEIKEVAQEKRLLVSHKKTELETKALTLSSVIEDIKAKKQPKIENDLKDYTDNVKRMSSELKDRIDFVADKLIFDAKDFHDIERQNLSYTLSKFDRLHQQTMNSIKNMEHCLEEKHDIIFMNLEKPVNDDYDNLDSIPDVTQPAKLEPLNVENFICSVVEEIQSVLMRKKTKTDLEDQIRKSIETGMCLPEEDLDDLI